MAKKKFDLKMAMELSQEFRTEPERNAAVRVMEKFGIANVVKAEGSRAVDKLYSNIGHSQKEIEFNRQTILALEAGNKSLGAEIKTMQAKSNEIACIIHEWSD